MSKKLPSFDMLKKIAQNSSILTKITRTRISAFVRARLCVCQNEGECMRERERERERERGRERERDGGGNSRAVDS